MISPYFVFLGAAFSLGGSARYAWQTLHGEISPNRVTWFLWAAAPLIGFLAQLDDGVGLPAVMTLSVGVGPAAIFAASFAGRAGYWRLTWFDGLCGAMSVVALVLWLTLSDPAVAIVFAVLADFLGAVPTLVKAWRAPDTERPGVFALSGLNGLITVLTLDRWAPAVSLFPLYIVGICSTSTLLVVARTRIVRRRLATLSPT